MEDHKKRTKLWFLCPTLKRMKIKVEKVFPTAITLIERKLNNSLKKLDRRWRKNVSNKVSHISPLNIGELIQCHECEGFGHIKDGCSTFLKKQKKGLSITWIASDDKSEREIDNKVMDFIVKYDSCNEYSDEEMFVEELDKT